MKTDSIAYPDPLYIFIMIFFIDYMLPADYGFLKNEFRGIRVTECVAAHFRPKMTFIYVVISIFVIHN